MRADDVQVIFSPHDLEQSERPKKASPSVLSQSVPIIRVEGMARSVLRDQIAVEEPLQVRLAGEDVAVLMRTPGHDDELAAGYLYSERIILARDDIETINICASEDGSATNIVNVTPLDRGLVRPSAWSRLSEGYSSCGICGKTSVDQVMKKSQPLEDSLSIDEATIYRLAAQIIEAQATFRETGGLHAAALFTAQGELVVLREDVGRHNAVDKIIGHALLSRKLPLTAHILAVTSRASFEVVQKAANAGISLLAVMSAPSTLAVQLAEATGMTLVAFLRARRFNIYSGAHRIRQGDGQLAQ